VKVPSAAEIAAIAGAIGLLAQHFGVVVPAASTSEANRDANWAARDALGQCNDERDRLLERLLEHHE
jgi:hypothetical protein